MSAQLPGRRQRLPWPRQPGPASKANNIDVTGGTVAECLFNSGIAGCWEYLTLQVTLTNGCRFAVGGPGTTDDCGRFFHKGIDKCDGSSTQYKQGNTVTSNSAVWRIDPNVAGREFDMFAFQRTTAL
ncbi:hypothetical protein F5B18DRAFT_646562 [Nemania serpens]|nr:hypothetical protein F5B18DRAFT_646562 [Nemania serpens]